MSITSATIDTPHISSSHTAFRRCQELRLCQVLALDGENLDIGAVAAVARHGLVPSIKQIPQLKECISRSIEVLTNHLNNGWVVYGVNTGFGGSADARPDHLKRLQVALIQHTQSTIIRASDKQQSRVDRDGQSHVIPDAWIKAAILTRANQNLRGHSAVRLEVIETLLQLLQHDITPLVPLRGTISASGDLMPLSYIAGTLTGNPDNFVRLGPGQDKIIVSSNVALEKCGIQPIELSAKEGLGLINGTAPSAALASLVIYEANQLAILVQALTAFTAECLGANVEWANEFIHRIRPHRGQIEAAYNIRYFLESSKYVIGLTRKKRMGQGLWQDRYSIRTAPQWIGPYLEDLMLAQQQVETELNSTSDNPVIDIGQTQDNPDGDVYSGGNFQATAITSAMEKTRVALQMMGRMLFSQCTELINPTTNNGLDPNLVFGDPNDSYTMKGIDVNISAYMSELAALAHPVSSHVQSAEMHNQGINSLAFLSARRTMEAVDVLSHMCASHLYVCCQAIDLRAYHERFLCANLISPYLQKYDLGSIAMQQTEVSSRLDQLVRHWWYEASKVAHCERATLIASKVASHITSEIMKEASQKIPASSILNLQRGLEENMKQWLQDPSNNPYPSQFVADGTKSAQGGLGRGADVLYRAVRTSLGVCFHQGLRTCRLTTIGSDVSQIYEAIRAEAIFQHLMESPGSTLPN